MLPFYYLKLLDQSDPINLREQVICLLVNNVCLNDALITLFVTRAALHRFITVVEHKALFFEFPNVSILIL